jgi:HEAT repeat protein
MSMSEPPPPLRQIAPTVSERTAALVERMLAFRPVDRPTMAEVAQQLQGGSEHAELLDLSEDIGEDKTEQGPPPLQLIQSISRPPRPPAVVIGPGGGQVATPVSPPAIPSPPPTPLPPTPSQASVPVVSKPPEPPPEVIRPLDAPPGTPRRTSGQAPRVEDARMTGVLPRAGQQAGHPWLAFLGGALVALLGVGLWATRKPPQQPPPPPPGDRALTATPPAPVTPAGKEPPQAPAQKMPAPAPSPPAPAPAEDPAAVRAEAVAVLREGLGATDAAVRRQAVRLLALRGVEGAAGLIAPLLTDRDAKVQREAAEALAQLGDKGAIPGLATLVEKTLDAHTFVTAADALDRLGDPRGRARLQEALQARAADVRAHGAALLVSRGDAAAREALARALAGGVPPDLRVQGLTAQGAEGIEGLAKLAAAGGGEARVLAAQALLRQGDPRGKAALQQAAGKSGPQQVAAAQALAEAGDPAGCPLLREAAGPGRSDAERARAAAGLAGCGQGERQMLRALLKDRVPGVRVAAAGALLAK